MNNPNTNQITNPVVIRFVADINPQSINILMANIENKLREGKNHFKILLSSNGGSVFHAVSCYNFLKGIPATIETHNIGNIDSAASVLFSAGTKRYSCSNASFLFHGISLGMNQGNIPEKQLREVVANIDTDRHKISSIVCNACSIKQSEISALMNKGKTLSSSEAKKLGLVHEVEDKLFELGCEIIGIG